MDLAKINEIAGIVSCIVGIISLVYTLAQKSTNHSGTRTSPSSPKTTGTTLSDLRRRHSSTDTTAVKMAEWRTEQEETHYDVNSGVDDEERWQSFGFTFGIGGIVGAIAGWYDGYKMGSVLMSVHSSTSINKIMNSSAFSEIIGAVCGAGAGAMFFPLLCLPWFMWPNLTTVSEKLAVLAFTYGFISFVTYALIHSHQFYIH